MVWKIHCTSSKDSYCKERILPPGKTSLFWRGWYLLTFSMPPISLHKNVRCQPPGLSKTKTSPLQSDGWMLASWNIRKGPSARNPLTGYFPKYRNIYCVRYLYLVKQLEFTADHATNDKFHYFWQAKLRLVSQGPWMAEIQKWSSEHLGSNRQIQISRQKFLPLKNSANTLNRIRGSSCKMMQNWRILCFLGGDWPSLPERLDRNGVIR